MLQWYYQTSPRTFEVNIAAQNCELVYLQVNQRLFFPQLSRYGWDGFPHKIFHHFRKSIIRVSNDTFCCYHGKYFSIDIEWSESDRVAFSIFHQLFWYQGYVFVVYITYQLLFGCLLGTLNEMKVKCSFMRKWKTYFPFTVFFICSKSNSGMKSIKLLGTNCRSRIRNLSVFFCTLHNNRHHSRSSSARSTCQLFWKCTRWSTVSPHYYWRCAMIKVLVWTALQLEGI